jgi:hypothetical protein
MTTLHKALAELSGVSRCATCGQRIKLVPGGQGPTWVHADSGAVAAPNPPAPDPRTTDIFWIADAPIKYEIRKGNIKGDVRIARYEDSDENCQQALLEIRRDGDTMRLAQTEGDLDANKQIAADQDYVKRNARQPFNIWRRIWEIAL